MKNFLEIIKEILGFTLIEEVIVEEIITEEVTAKKVVPTEKKDSIDLKMKEYNDKFWKDYFSRQ